MKRLKLIPLLAIACLALSGCTKEYITYGSQTFTHEYTVTPSQWDRYEGANLPGGENYLYAVFNNSDITPDVLHHGTVHADVYLVYDIQNNLGSWNPLPYVYPLEVYQTNQTTGQQELIIVPENIRFEWEQGKVTFIIQDLDGYDPLDLISTLTIRVSVIKDI